MNYKLRTKNEERRTKKQSGQTLLEVVIALSAAVLIISAVVVAVISALSNQQYSINQNQATQYAQEGLDILRKTSQSDWNAFSQLNAHYCLGSDNSLTDPFAGSCSGYKVGIFLRDINIAFNPSSCLSPTPVTTTNAQVTSTVSWADGKCTDPLNQYCHKVELVSCFYKP